jgi:hypothetical protein
MGKLLEQYRFDDHIRECDHRYEGVLKQIENIDQRLDRMEQLLIDIKHTINEKK